MKSLFQLAMLSLGLGLLLPGAEVGAQATESLTSPSNHPKKPNIVVIVADDLGYADCGFNGGEQIKTPHLDRLAARGSVLESFYTQPVCSPTRAALLTGRYPLRLGLQVGVIRPWSKFGLDLEERTLADGLKSVGYNTAITGKWHLGSIAPEYWPNARGFDHAYGHYFGAIDFFTHDRDQVHDWFRNGEPVYEEGYSTHLIAQEAVKFIQQQSKEAPFFLYVPFNAVHTPLQVPEQYKAPYADLKEPRRTVAGMLAALDEAVGQIVAEVEAQGETDNTIFLFTSDNGGFNPGAATDNGPLRAGKGTLYEGGVRTAAFVTWPGKIPSATRNPQPVHIVDVYPTLLKLAGASLEQPAPLDGLDVWPVWSQGVESPRQETVFNSTPTIGAIRVGDWKLIVRTPDESSSKKQQNAPEVELYNLADDLGETKNLASEKPELVAQLRQRYQTYADAAVPPKNRQESQPRGAENITRAILEANPHLRKASVPAANKTSGKRPNFLILIADDLNWRDLGFTGNPDVKTPNLDQLATQSAQLNHVFTPATTCSPTRHALLTGLYSVRSGAFPNHTSVYDGTRSIYSHLKDVGYRVAILNKTHVNPPASFPWEHLGGVPDKSDRSDEEVIGQPIEAFITRDAEQPWFLVFASNDPHSPWTRGPKDLYDPQALTIPPYLHDNELTRKNLANYYAEITKFDQQVGTILQTLEKSGQSENTLVLFLSEQGSSFPHGGKWTVYDNGIRAASLARWPGKIAPGTQRNALVQYVDIPPTFIEAAGIDPGSIDTGTPDATGDRGFDGRSFLSVLLGKNDQHRHYVFAQHTNVGISGAKAPYPIRAVRDTRYKYIRNLTPENEFNIGGIHRGDLYQSWVADAEKQADKESELAHKVRRISHRPAEELYDLKSDPYETVNLADDPALAAVKQRLRAQLDAWMIQQGDQGLTTELSAWQRVNQNRQESAKKVADQANTDPTSSGQAN